LRALRRGVKFPTASTAGRSSPSDQNQPG